MPMIAEHVAAVEILLDKERAKVKKLKQALRRIDIMAAEKAVKAIAFSPDEIMDLVHEALKESEDSNVPKA